MDVCFDRMTQEYGDGCKEFIRFAVEHAENNVVIQIELVHKTL